MWWYENHYNELWCCKQLLTTFWIWLHFASQTLYTQNQMIGVHCLQKVHETYLYQCISHAFFCSSGSVYNGMPLVETESVYLCEFEMNEHTITVVFCAELVLCGLMSDWATTLAILMQSVALIVHIQSHPVGRSSQIARFAALTPGSQITIRPIHAFNYRVNERALIWFWSCTHL